MRFGKIAGTLLLAAAVCAPQPLPPEIVTLARLKSRSRDELARLPNYTCLETVSRFYRESQTRPLNALDTVRLEIVYSDHHEWYNSPGDKSSGIGNPARLIGSGMIGTGAFASALNNILGAARFHYEGKEEIAGRAAVKYSFVFPRISNAFQISIPGGASTVGEKGFLWADARSFDLIRLESNAAEIPSFLPMVSQRTVINYAPVRIGDHDTLLAQSADMGMVRSKGIEEFDHTEYSLCRSFSTETTLSFDDGSGSETPQAAPHATRPPKVGLRAQLAVTVQLTTPITNADAVGTLIQGSVTEPVVSKGQVVIPAGALVHGRIRRLEHYDATTYMVGLEFTEVETATGSEPFYAELLRTDPSTVLKPVHEERIPVGSASVTLPELPGVASFFATGSTFKIPAGFRTVWRTLGPIRGL